MPETKQTVKVEQTPRDDETVLFDKNLTDQLSADGSHLLREFEQLYEQGMSRYGDNGTRDIWSNELSSNDSSVLAKDLRLVVQIFARAGLPMGSTDDGFKQKFRLTNAPTSRWLKYD